MEAARFCPGGSWRVAPHHPKMHEVTNYNLLLPGTNCVATSRAEGTAPALSRDFLWGINGVTRGSTPQVCALVLQPPISARLCPPLPLQRKGAAKKWGWQSPDVACLSEMSFQV